jgi:P27 family predicted phage terminase small subunit
MRLTDIKPPSTLSVSARKWFENIQQEYAITDAGGLLILTTAAEAYDRMKQAQAVVTKEVLTFTDRHGQMKMHPACQVERDNRSQLFTAMRALNLNIEPLAARPGRPSGKPYQVIGA